MIRTLKACQKRPQTAGGEMKINVAPLRGVVNDTPGSGGLRCASTTGYYLD